MERRAKVKLEGGQAVFLELAMAAALAQINPDERLCDNRVSTVDVNACLVEKLKRANQRLDRYVQAAIHRHKDEPAVRRGILASQKAFEAYRKIECDTVFEAWKEGTIRGSMLLGCQIGLTDGRTHDVWQHWLEYMDSTPPILPEPAPTK